MNAKQPLENQQQKEAKQICECLHDKIKPAGDSICVIMMNEHVWVQLSKEALTTQFMGKHVSKVGPQENKDRLKDGLEIGELWDTEYAKDANPHQ